MRDLPNLVIYVERKEGPILKDVRFWRLDAQKRLLESGRAREDRHSFDQANSVIKVLLRDGMPEAQSKTEPEDYRQQGDKT